MQSKTREKVRWRNIGLDHARADSTEPWVWSFGWQDFHSHKWMYDEFSLEAPLKRVGFEEAGRCHVSRAGFPAFRKSKIPAELMTELESVWKA